MERLPGHVLDMVLFKIDPKTLVNMRCTNRSMQSHIYDPLFVSEYFSKLPSGLLHMSTYGSNLLTYHTLDNSRLVKTRRTLKECQILDSCSGLVLLHFVVDGGRLCVANPLTKKFRFLEHSRLMAFTRSVVRRDEAKLLGFMVNRIDRSTQSFKIVQIREVGNSGVRTYRFAIYSGNSWTYSKTNLTCSSSKLSNFMKKPVHLDGSLHWLRRDGSIVAFNPETDQARLIPLKFPQGLHSRTLFAADHSNLTLISATEEVIDVYALENIISDPKWVLVRQIKTQVVDKKWFYCWNLEAYDGKRLVLNEGRRRRVERMVHVYDLSANKWVVISSIPGWCDANQDMFQFIPLPYSVVGLSDEILACDDQRISSLSSIMGMIDGSSSKEVENHLRGRTRGEEIKGTSIVFFGSERTNIVEQATKLSLLNKKRN